MKRETETARPLFITPPVDIFESDEGLTVLADLPGVELDNVDIRVKDDQLTIEGRTSYSMQDEGHLHQEFRLVNFRRRFQLATEVARDKISAEVKDGVLTINMPHAEKMKPRKIKVKVA